MNALCAECNGCRNKDAIKQVLFGIHTERIKLWQDSFVLILTRMHEKELCSKRSRD